MFGGRKKYRRTARPVLVGVLLGVMAIGSTMTASVQADQAVQRPISDFLSKQGTTMVFNTPVPDQIGWVNNPQPCLRCSTMQVWQQSISRTTSGFRSVRQPVAALLSAHCLMAARKSR